MLAHTWDKKLVVVVSDFFKTVIRNVGNAKLGLNVQESYICVVNNLFAFH